MKINYDLMMQEELKTITGRPKLLLHVCCGPCSSYIVKELSDVFDITVYYSNANIYPEAEYQRRYDELSDFITRFNEDAGRTINVVEDVYDNAAYMSHLEPYKDTGEKGYRCYVCYGLRMQKAYNYALEHHYDYWTTSLSVSPHKNSQWINEIGASYPSDQTKFLYSDFKKRNGYLKSTQMTAAYGMYRQSYCGCQYSYEEMLTREHMNKGVID